MPRRLRDIFAEIFGDVAIDRAFAEFDATPEVPEEWPSTGLLTTEEQLRINGLRLRHYHLDEGNVEAFGGATRNATVVYRPRQDLAHTLEFATAICSEKDCFTKKQGARIALTRFITGQTSRLPPRVDSDQEYLLDADLLDRIFQ